MADAVDIPKIAPVIPYSGKIRRATSGKNNSFRRSSGHGYGKKDKKEREEAFEEDTDLKQEHEKRMLPEDAEDSESTKKNDVVGRLVDLSV